MALGLQIAPRQTLGLRLVLGGLTGEKTVFPLAAKLLKQISTQKMLYKKYRMDENERAYRSVMDQLLCETLPVFRAGCFEFYQPKGPPFRDLYNTDYCHKIDLVLVGYLRIGKTLAKKRVWGGEFPQWCDLIETINDLSKEGEDQ